jgi:Putative Ig domain
MPLDLHFAPNSTPSPTSSPIFSPSVTAIPSPSVTPSASPSPSPSPSPSGTSGPGLPAHQGELVLWLLVGGIVAVGIIVFVGRKFLTSDQGGQGTSFIRSWIAISLVLGLLIFCAAALLGTDASLQSILFGGLVASTGSAIAFYFAAQAGAAALNAVAAQGGVAPNAFSAIEPNDGTVGTSYSYSFAANGQPAPSYKLISGTLPPGLTLDSNGLLHGMPTATGTSTFTIGAFNSSDILLSPAVSVAISAAS